FCDGIKWPSSPAVRDQFVAVARMVFPGIRALSPKFAPEFAPFRPFSPLNSPAQTRVVTGFSPNSPLSPADRFGLRFACV
ncbi:MAG: hypothetical protein WC082_16245, partial [Victivallales bacterium]